MDARRASDALKARAEKTDKADARALAEMLASGWYSAVHVKSLESHQLKALLGARDQLVRVKRQLYGQVRGLLRPFGIKISQRVGAKSFDEAVRMACNKETYSISRSAPCLTRLRTWPARSRSWTSRLALWRKMKKACWHLMSVPGVGPITALAFTAAIEDPHRFGSNRDVGAYLGLTPKRYQSGERDVSLSISRQGDEMVRHYLYEAANCLLTTVTGASALKSWGLKMVKRCGAKRARTAVARKLAVLLLRLWKQESHFEAQSA